MGKTSWGNASSVEEAPFEELCDDSLVVHVAHNIEHIDPICTEPLDLTPISSLLLPTTFSHLHAFHESPGDIRGYNPSLDPSCAYLEDMPRKIEWTTSFDYYFNFSMAFGKYKTALTLFAQFLLVFSYSHHLEMHAQAHDKLLRALTNSELTTRILRGKEWLMLLKSSRNSSGTFSTRPGIIALTLPPFLFIFIFLFLLFVFV